MRNPSLFALQFKWEMLFNSFTSNLNSCFDVCPKQMQHKYQRRQKMKNYICASDLFTSVFKFKCNERVVIGKSKYKIRAQIVEIPAFWMNSSLICTFLYYSNSFHQPWNTITSGKFNFCHSWRWNSHEIRSVVRQEATKSRCCWPSHCTWWPGSNN